jgi:hypothetical protein
MRPSNVVVAQATESGAVVEVAAIEDGLGPAETRAGPELKGVDDARCGTELGCRRGQEEYANRRYAMAKTIRIAEPTNANRVIYNRIHLSLYPASSPLAR